MNRYGIVRRYATKGGTSSPDLNTSQLGLGWCRQDDRWYTMDYTYTNPVPGPVSAPKSSYSWLMIDTQ
jgi:hypothetical protein